MLERQKASLVVAAERSVAAEARSRDDAVARHEDRQPIPGTERARGAGGARAARERRELAVRDDLTAWDVAQRAREPAAERGQLLEVELDVREVDVGAGEVLAKPRDESRHEIVTATCIAFRY